MLLQACLNGPRPPGAHPALPLSARQLAADAQACVRAGAGALHLHPRGADGLEALQPEIVDHTVAAVRAACGAPVGVATCAWIEPDVERRVAAVAAWTAPDYASVNLSEPGAGAVMRALLKAGIGIEAGVWSVSDAETLAASGMAARVPRVLVEIIEVPAAEAPAAAREIDAALDDLGIRAPRLHHGEEAACWPVLRQALALRFDSRIGLEDTLLLETRALAVGNGQLVAARRRAAAAVAGSRPGREASAMIRS